MKTLGNLSRLPLLLVLLLGATAGCKQSNEKPTETTIKKQVPLKQWWEELPREVYGDPELKKTPRIQFSWDPDGNDKYSIGSVRIDGTDMRITVDEDLLYSQGDNGLHSLVRSPNGRYIVFLNRITRMFIDLKTMTMKSIEEGGMLPRWTFPDDGHSVLYYIDARLKRYYFKTGKLEELPMIFSSGMHVMRGKNRILAVRKKVVEIYDFKANLLRTIDIIGTGSYGDPKKEEIESMNVASANGKMLYFDTRYTGSFVVDLDNPKHPVIKEKFSNPMFDPEGRYLYGHETTPSNLKDKWHRPLPGYSSIGRLDLKTGEKSIVFVCKVIRTSMDSMSLYNY